MACVRLGEAGPLLRRAMILGAVALSAALPVGSLLSDGPLSGAEPGWDGHVVLRGPRREQVRSQPMVLRPYRPLHVLGNTTRRRHYRGTFWPGPRDVLDGASAWVTRRTAEPGPQTP